MELADMLSAFAVFTAILVGMGITVALVLQFVHGVSSRMSQSGVNAQQEVSRLGKEG